jgi:hypothetical protein
MRRHIVAFSAWYAAVPHAAGVKISLTGAIAVSSAAF